MRGAGSRMEQIQSRSRIWPGGWRLRALHLMAGGFAIRCWHLTAGGLPSDVDSSLHVTRARKADSGNCPGSLPKRVGLRRGTPFPRALAAPKGVVTWVTHD